MSDTPRTDEIQLSVRDIPGASIMARLCRQLERELTAEKERCDKWKACAVKLYEENKDVECSGCGDSRENLCSGCEGWKAALDSFDALMREEA